MIRAKVESHNYLFLKLPLIIFTRLDMASKNSQKSRLANDHGHDHNSEVDFLRPYGRLIDYNRLWVSQEV